MRVFSIVSLFLFLSTLSVAQIDMDQRIDIRITDQPVSSAIIEIARLADISIAFQSNLFDSSQRVTLNEKQIPLDIALNQCLEKTDVTFKVEDDQILLFKKSNPTITVSGYVEDGQNGERLMLASVFQSNSQNATVTNEYGYFSIEVPSGSIAIQANYIGYQATPLKLNLTKDTTILISMNSYLTTDEVVIADQAINQGDKRYRIAQGRKIQTEDIENRPSLGGESDIYRYIQTQAGVTNGADGLGGLYVRGGNAEHNLVLLDGVPVFNPSHSLGLFSIFNSSAIRSARFIKEGFSARYGGRLASVVDVRTKEGNTQNVSGEIEIGTIATKALLELPIVKNKSALLLSGRRTHIDPFIRDYSIRKKSENLDDGQTDYKFYDFNAKFHTTIGEKDKLYMSYYQGGDDFMDLTSWENYYDDDNDVERYEFSYQDQQLWWRNKIGSLRWNRPLGKNAFLNATATYSQYDYGSFNDSEYLDEGNFSYPYYNDIWDNRSQIMDYGVRLDIDQYAGKHLLKYGGSMLVRDLIPASILYSSVTDALEEGGLVSAVDSSESFLGYISNEYSGYIEDIIDLGNETKLQVGVRATAFQAILKNHISIQPRLSLTTPLSDNWKTNIALTKTTQFLHVLSSSDAGLPTDIWVPSTDDVDPEHAYQASISLMGSLKKGWGVDISAYYKTMTGLITYAEETKQPGLVETDPEYWEEFVSTGEGSAYGVELGIFKNQGRTTGALNYTFSKAERTFTDVNDGLAFPFGFDRPHNVNLQINHRLSNKVQFQVAQYFSSGRPITLLGLHGKFVALSNVFGEVEQLSSVNGLRLDDYIRTDVNVSMQFGKAQTKHVINLGVYNLFNKKNPYYRYSSIDDGVERKENALPFVPSFSYRVGFGG